MDVLTISQLSQLATIPSQLNGIQDVREVLGAIQTADFGAFFDTVSPVIEVNEYNFLNSDI